MSQSTTLDHAAQDSNASDAPLRPPVVTRDATGAPDQTALINCVQWFLDNDQRVNIVRHAHVEELFQWKQTRDTGAEIFRFDLAEDRLAVGIFQALATNADEQSLHAWIADLIAAIDDASKTNEAITEAHDLGVDRNVSALMRAQNLPTDIERDLFLTTCWLEVLCTAEARVLGWIYQDLYRRPFHPDNFPLTR